MSRPLKQAFRREMSLARELYRRGDLDGAFRHLERAHILGQRYFVHHLVSHLWMLRIGLRRLGGREVAGQLLRLVAVLPGHLFGWIPLGNTGGANVSPVRPMTPPADLAPYVAGYSLRRALLLRLALYAGLGTGIAGVSWAVGVI
jgi:hypothetical protein